MTGNDFLPGVELRFGESWTEDVGYLLRLANATGKHPDLSCVRDVVDLVVGGDNLTAQLGEDSIFVLLADLLQGLGDLHLGHRRKAIIEFQDAPWELVLARRGTTLAISLYCVVPGDEVAVHDRAAPLEHVVAAVVASADALAARLDGIAAGLSAHPMVVVPAVLRGAPHEQAPSGEGPVGHGQEVSIAAPPGGGFGVTLDCTDRAFVEYDGLRPFDLHALLCQGHLVWEAEGEVTGRFGEYPFRALRGLVADVRDVLEARGGRTPRPVRRLRRAVLVQDGGRQYVALQPAGVFVRPGPHPALQGGQPVSLAALIDGLVACVEGVVSAAIVANPQMENNQRLEALRSDAIELKAWYDDLASEWMPWDGVAPQVGEAVCLAVGVDRGGAETTARFRLESMSRVRWRQSWTAQGALDVLGMRRYGDCLYVPSGGEVACYEIASGRTLWLRPAMRSEDAYKLMGCGPFILALGGQGHTQLLYPETGEGWALQGTWKGAVAGVAAFAAGASRWIVVGRGTGLEGFSESGDPTWTWSSGHGHITALTGHGPRVVAGSNRGFVYGVDAQSGAVAWKCRAGAGASAILPVGEERVLVLDRSGDEATWVHAGSGRQLGVTPLDARPTRYRRGDGRIALWGDDALVVMDERTGGLLWRREAGPVDVLTAQGRAVLMDVDGVECVCEATGDTLWRRDDLRPLCAVARSGALVVLGAEGASLLRLADGVLIDTAQGLPPSPAWFDLGEDLRFVFGEQDEEGSGRVSCYTLAGFLALVQ